MLKECKVVMLPTNEKARIVKQNNQLFYNPVLEYNYRYGKNNMHMYILSDDEIVDNTWTLCLDELDHPEDAIRFHKTGAYCSGCRKIIASTDKKLNLPTPSKAFIAKYCELGGIDTIMVEYVEKDITEFYSGVEFYGESEVIVGYKEVPKVSPDNTITIHPTKATFTRAEVEQILNKYQDHLQANTNITLFGIASQWFNKNY